MKDAIHDIGAWPPWSEPASAGWSETGLAVARSYAETLPTEAVMIVTGGRVVSAWGNVISRYNVHSIRKSLLSALIGIHEEAGRIDLGASLTSLGIDDKLGLTTNESLSTVLDLLRGRYKITDLSWKVRPLKSHIIIFCDGVVTL